MEFQHLIEQYGYAAILLGTFFEGETILIIAGFLAHQGYLSLIGVIAAAFIGAMLGDQLYFYIGRWKGRSFIESRPRLDRHSERVNKLIEKHQTWLILSFRFMYGIRTVTPFILGSSKVSPLRFFVLNMIGALAWAAALGVASYYFGHALESLIGHLKQYEMLIIACIVVIALSFWLYKLLAPRLRKSKSSQQ